MKPNFYSLIIFFLIGCGYEEWKPVKLAGGYQIMIMNAQEVYIADSKNELILGPKVKEIGISPVAIVVYCGDEQVTVNGFSNTTGFNIIELDSGRLKKNLVFAEVEEYMRAKGISIPKMYPLRSYLETVN